MPWDTKKTNKYKRLAVIASISTACILFAMKLFATIVTGSLAILSSLVDSLSDIVASYVSYIAVKFSIKPASCTHRYGYLKAESLSALFQSAFIGGSGIFVVYSAVNRLFHPMPLEQTGVGIAVMVAGLLLTLALILFQRFVIKHTDSLAISADSAHYMVDILTNSATILSLIFVKKFAIEWLDILTAFGIAGYLLYYSVQIGCEAIHHLMDRELPIQIRENVLNIVRHTRHVKGIHDFRTRDMGGMYFFELHLEMEASLPLIKAHHISEIVEEKIKKAYPNAQVIIHQDPFGIKEKRLDDTLQMCSM